MRRWALALPLLLVAGCGSGPQAAGGPAARLLIAGAVDTGGEAAAVVTADPEGLFRDLRFVVRDADLAVAGPLAGPQTEEVMRLLAVAGFDAVLAGGGSGRVETLLVAREGQFLAFTAGTLRVALRSAGAGRQWSGEPGGATWFTMVPARLSATATVVLLDGPPGVARPAGRALARWGADVVAVPSGKAPAVEVIQSVSGRPTLVASGLGPLLSDDGAPGERTGALVEVLADGTGVVAYRVGRTNHADLRVHFAEWDLPSADAVLLDGEWWALARAVRSVVIEVPADTARFAFGDLIAAAVGDVTGDGAADIVASYRHPRRPSAVGAFWPEAVPVDALGRSAHLGVFDSNWEALWAAGRIPRPVGALAACDGSVALAYTGLDDPQSVATGAAVWDGFGLRSAPDLPGAGQPGCADVDGDGRLDPVILGRSP